MNHMDEKGIKMESRNVSLSDISNVAQELIENLTESKSGNQATVVALSGNLGAGKTTFTKSCAEVLGISPEQITSPTFVIAKFYEIGGKGRAEGPTQPATEFPWKQFIHIDAYRLESGDEILKLGFKDYISDPNNLIFIEWPENISSAMPENTTTLTLTVIDETTRNISLDI